MEQHDGAKEKITKARESYLRAHPFDPHKHAVLGHNTDGIPAGFLTLPDMGEMQIVAMKFGYEFLAAVRTDDEVDEWISNISKVAGSPDLTGIILAHAFRGIAPVVGQIIDQDPGLAQTMQRISAEGWEKTF